MAYINLFKEMWRYAKGHRWKVIVFLILHAISQLATIAQPLVFAQILNSLQKQPDEIIKTILGWLAVWIGLFVWFNIFHRAANYFCYDVTYRVKQAYLNESYDILTKLPLKWHTDHHSGSTINRINTAGEALYNFTINHYQYVAFFMLFWGPLIALLILSWQVSAITFIIAIASIFVMRFFDKQLVVLYREINNNRHKISSVFYDYVSNIKTIITLRLGSRTGKEFNHQIDQGYAPYMKAESQINQWKWLSVTFGVLIMEAGVIFYYIWEQLARGGTVLVGNVAAVFQYLQQISKTYMDIAGNYQQIIAWHTDFETAKPIRDSLIIASEDQRISNDWKQIKINNLNFEYEDGKQTLSDISINFKKGDKIALVGESGSGKSSLMALLRGLYESNAVHFSLDDSEFETLSPIFGTTTLIPQEPEIFENTIRYNITIGIEHAEESLIEATKLARFDRVLENLPKGLDTDVREKGVTLSGGERQRLALARGVLAAKNSSIILMDEPTSSVDAHNELVIYENIFDHFKEQTVISSIHRLHLLGQFDQVIVMEQGQILQAGTFEDLKGQSGLFQTLWGKYQESSKA
jgi:ATP-binding cassette subfamily B protein